MLSRGVYKARMISGGYSKPEPVNLSETLGLETGAAFRCLSPDGKHLFFTGGGVESGTNWVASCIIEELRPK